MNKRQMKKYNKKRINASGMFIKARYRVYHEIKYYYRIQKIMNKSVKKGNRLWQSI